MCGPTLLWSLDLEQQRKLIEPDKARILRLFQNLPRNSRSSRFIGRVLISHQGLSRSLEDILTKLYLNIRHIAFSEIQRHGWHRSSGQPVKELRRLMYGAASLLDKWANCSREAQQALFAYGVGYRTHALGIIELRQAALHGVKQAKNAARHGSSKGGRPNCVSLATRITYVVAVAFYETTAQDPLRHHRLGRHKADANFPELLGEMFEILGIRASVEYQCALLRRRRRTKRSSGRDRQ